MSQPNGKGTTSYPPLRTRLLFAAVPVAILLAGYYASSAYFEGRENAVTLERMPDRPALEGAAERLAPALDEAIARLRDDPSAANVGQLGMLYHANGFHAEAAGCYARAGELDPHNPRWHWLNAVVLEHLGRTSNAEAARRKAEAAGLEDADTGAWSRELDQIETMLGP